MRNARKTERGIALLATLMAIALMTVIVADFTGAAMLGYRSAANQANALRADYLARSGVQVGTALLAQDARNDEQAQQPHDSLDELWAAPFPPIQVGGGIASLSIVDDTRKLDINRLVNMQTGQFDPAFAQTLNRLFAEIGVSQDLLPALIDWLDPDSVPTAGGAENEYYLGLVPPYEPRNGPMPTIGDLRMVRGVDDATFLKLSRFLTVAPDKVVNVNTAPAEVLAALLPELNDDPSLVKEILAARREKPFLAADDVADLPGFSQFGDRLVPLLTVQSDYFTITGMGSFAGTRKLAFAMVHREGTGEQVVSWRED
jgi:general secretion pathway protein K